MTDSLSPDERTELVRLRAKVTELVLVLVVVVRAMAAASREPLAHKEA